MATFLSKNTGHPHAPLALYKPGARAPDASRPTQCPRRPDTPSRGAHWDARGPCLLHCPTLSSPVTCPSPSATRGKQSRLSLHRLSSGDKVAERYPGKLKGSYTFLLAKSQRVNAGRCNTPKASHRCFWGADFPFFSEPQVPPL